ncbi:Hypothetical protein FKW44_006933 [Caligus rogercresseyi]|uniref:Uncharacterized protein n=1 Tax=Caligus rogercresseyi TaxID=217165 RepID=A0A7T8QT85_CALRO|nr:Hypothetical protein FKW44_006933 [Caligus rogercresseyi]
MTCLHGLRHTGPSGRFVPAYGWNLCDPPLGPAASTPCKPVIDCDCPIRRALRF